MTCSKEVALGGVVSDDGSCYMETASVVEESTTPVKAQDSTEGTILGSMNETALIQDLLTAMNPRTMVEALKRCWKPVENSDSLGSFMGVEDSEMLLHAIPLSQKLLSCMTWTSTDLQGSFACADLLSRLCLGIESSLLLQPSDILTRIMRLVAAKSPQTREGALRCMTTLIKESKEYCQVFMDCNAIDYILDRIDYESGVEVATYACRSVLSLVTYVRDEVDKLETLLLRVLPTLIKMLQTDGDTVLILKSLQCLEELKDIELVASKLREDEVVSLLGPLIEIGDKEIKRMALVLLGDGVHHGNSEQLKDLPVEVAYQLLQELFERSPEQLEPVKLRLLECISAAVHQKQFPVSTREAQFFIRMMLQDAKSCASKIIDILVVAWDLYEGMAEDMAQSDRFLSRLPHVTHVTPAALQIIYAMFQSDIVSAHAMARNLGPSELQALRKEMQEGTREAAMVVLDIFMQLIEQQGQCSDVVEAGILEDLVKWFDSDSHCIKRRCWRMCSRILEICPREAAPICVHNGLVQKYEVLFVEFLDRLQTSSPEEALQNESGLNDLFIILKSVSELKSGAKAICKTSIIMHLLDFITPMGIASPEIHGMIMNVLVALPAMTSRKLADHRGFGVITELVKRRDVNLKRLGFEILKHMSFKKCVDHIEDSDLVPQLCQFLHSSNARLKTDSVTVLCRMAKFSFDVVAGKISDTGCGSVLWTASRGVDDEDDRRILRRIFQTLKSIEATDLAAKRKMGRTLSKQSSSSSISSKDASERIFDKSRTSSDSVPNKLSKRLDRMRSVGYRPPRSAKMASSDPDLAFNDAEGKSDGSFGVIPRTKSLVVVRKA